MNWILLYILCFCAVIAVLIVGYFLNNQAIACVKKYQYKQNKKGFGAKELADTTFKAYKLTNTALTTLRAKKTNYFSSRYNAIKLSPETIYSPYLFDLAIFLKCSNQAKKQQYNYISSMLYNIVTIISKAVSALFVPVVFIFAIINISFGLEHLANIATIVALICFVITFLIQLSLYFIIQSKTKQIKDDIKSLQTFEDDEISILYDLIIALNKYDFFDYTRLSLGIFTLLNPATIFEKKEK